MTPLQAERQQRNRTILKSQKDGKTYDEIAKEYGLSAGAIRKIFYIHKHNTDKSSPKDSTYESILELHNSGHTKKQIAEITGYTVGHISYIIWNFASPIKEHMLAMTHEEICRSYRLSKDRRYQILVLAELNATSKKRIKKILEDSGEIIHHKKTK